MHFITKGTVDVVSEDGEIVYETLKEGDYFGEMCCLCGTPSLASFKYVHPKLMCYTQKVCMVYTFAPAKYYVCFVNLPYTRKCLRYVNFTDFAVTSNTAKI